MTALGRAATWIAVVVLALNALLLGAAGLGADRPVLLAAAAAAGALAVLVLVAWRRHQRTLAAIARDREALRDETLGIRDLLRRGRP